MPGTDSPPPPAPQSDATPERVYCHCSSETGALHLSFDTQTIHPKTIEYVRADLHTAAVDAAVTVFKAIAEHIQEPGTFRYLIYDRLGFPPGDYGPLYLAGGMAISNLCTEVETLRDQVTAAVERAERAEARWQAGREEDPPFDAQDFADCFEQSTSQEIMQEAYELGLERGRIQRITTLESELAEEKAWREEATQNCARLGGSCVRRSTVDDLESQLATATVKLREMDADKRRLDAVLRWSHEIVCRIPGGIRCVDNRYDIDAVLRQHAALSAAGDESGEEG